MKLQPGSLLQGGKYKIEKVLGQGGFGITYFGVQVGLNRRVAIKEFFIKEYCNRDTNTSHISIGSEGGRELVERFRRKFLKEAEMIAHLKNSHIISIYDIFEENNTAYYVMEYIDGGSLKDRVENKGVLSEAEALFYIRQIADALNYIHQNKILHLDVKPANVLLEDGQIAILIDFGISKHYDKLDGQTSTTPVGISKGYAPLEQYQQGGVQNFAPYTDIYSLGATLYYLLTGKQPPEANNVFNNGIPALPPSISVSTVMAIEKAMQPRWKDRPQSIVDFLALLNSNETIVENKMDNDDDTFVSETERKDTLFKKTVKTTTNKKQTNADRKMNHKWIIGIAVLIVSVIIGFWASGIEEKTDDILLAAETDSIIIANDSIVPVVEPTTKDTTTSLPQNEEDKAELIKAQKLAEEQKQLEEQKRQAERLAKEQRIREQEQLEKQRQAEEARLAAQRRAEEQKLQEEKAKQNITGKGTKTFYDCRYEGDLVEGKRHGSGTAYYNSGDVYVGEWKDDKMCGQGSYKDKDGNKYSGSFANDMIYGRGRYEFTDGTIYTGNFNKGQIDGKGTMTFPDGSKYIGNFNNGIREDTQATYIDPDGNIYTGNVSNDEMNGQGTLTFTNKSKYVGNFKNGMMHGYGVYYNADGSVAYRGEWVNNEPVQ
ncbi:protein kinase domain-containing protein [Bacteroides bouchesdurhonensis]|uniref:protein kinase domain-containing protein n=1 Tax=Bacteroides bouchesdurhonensis TaxID=1841855 RepID=UPI0011DD3790|nr:protein kinase [Bacteroides bouchesdurhonensis]